MRYGVPVTPYKWNHASHPVLGATILDALSDGVTPKAELMVEYVSPLS